MNISPKKNRYFDVEITLNEAEIQSIVGVLEEIQRIKNIPLDRMGGIRQELYNGLKNILEN